MYCQLPQLTKIYTHTRARARARAYGRTKEYIDCADR